MKRILVGVLSLAMTLGTSALATAQVTFQPEGCEFRVWFVVEPNVVTASVPTSEGQTVQSEIAELNPRLRDGYAHYFRAECTPVSVGPVSEADMLSDMNELVSMNRVQDAKVWVEKLGNGLIVGRARANIDSGQNVYFLDIRRYIGETSIFDVWAGAERFPTEGVVMFFRSVAYQGQLINE